jgi:hypothetical protein
MTDTELLFRQRQMLITISNVVSQMRQQLELDEPDWQAIFETIICLDESFKETIDRIIPYSPFLLTQETGLTGGNMSKENLLKIKEAILAADDLVTETVEVPEWSMTVYIRSMTGAERDKFESSAFNATTGKVNADNLRAKLVSICLVDVDGNRIFSDKEAIELGGKSAKVLSRLYDIATKLNALSDADVEELAKN